MTTPGSHGPGEQPPSGGPGWGPPAGSPEPGGSFAAQQPGSVPPPPPGQYPPPQQPSKGGAGKWLAIGGGLLAVLVIGILIFAFLGGGDPEVGDCLQEDGQELSVVDCDDSAAAWKLLGIQEGTQSYDEYQADPETCSAFPGTVQSFWVGENGDNTGQGVVYCVNAN